jgi:hypothetical protein
MVQSKYTFTHEVEWLAGCGRLFEAPEKKMNKCFCLSVISAVGLFFYSCKDKNSENSIKAVEEGTVTNNNSEYSFKPIKKGTVSCFATIKDKTGDVDFAIKNILKSNITFTKPRIVSGLGVKEKLDARTNPIEIEMTWLGKGDKEDFARCVYWTFKDIAIKDQLVTLKPDELCHIKFKLEDTLVDRRCNIVPFSDCFSEGKTKMSVVVCLMGQSAGEEDVKIAVSNTNTIHRKYIF